MAVGLFYTLEFTNVEQRFVKVLIGDTRSVETDTPVIIPLDPAGTPLIMSTIDNEENKFTPIKSQQATITFLSNNQTSLQTFADGPDDAFPVTILYGTTIIFYGFLSLADNSEAFISGRNEVTLTANDKLGALKDIPFTDFDNFNPQGKYKISRILMMCLQKTGLDLRLRVMNNLRHGTGVLTALATFDASENRIVLAVTTFFYVGQFVTITGTASNNITFTVTGVGQGIITIVTGDGVFTDEVEVTATFTDVLTADHIYEHYLDAKTFEEEIGTCENCYSVIEKILGNDCFLTQYKECWWIMRVDEFDSNPMYVSRFDENGEFEDTYIETTLLKNIGFLEVHYLSEEATEVLPTRPVNSVKLTYHFTYPLEIICNQDFSRGVGEVQDDTNPDQTLEYVAECWDVFSREADTLIDFPPDPGVDFKLVKRFEYGYEKEKYFKTIGSPALAVDNYFKSSPLRVSEGDKIDMSFDFRLIPDEDISAATVAYVILFADSGNIYEWYFNHNDLGAEETRWTLNNTGSYWVNMWIYNQAPGEDMTQWTSFGTTSLPVPEKGTVIVRLNNPLFNQEVDFTNFQISVQPFTNGSYMVYNGRTEKVTNTEDGFLAKVEDEVFISDGERELWKGAMFFLANDVYNLTVKWYDASKIALGFPTDPTTIRPYGQLQAYSVWNQYRLANRVFQFQSQGLGEDIPSLVHKFSITDVSSHSSDRKFLLLTKEADLYLCTVTGTLEQVYHTVEGKEYISPHEFKYIS